MQDNIIWKSEYNIGNLKIDMEHQKLFAVARKAINVNRLKNSENEKQKLKEIISELFTYVGSHFHHEQEYMQSIDYPDYENHKKLHKKMLAMLTTLISKLNSLDIKEIEKKLSDFIEEYFVKHIIVEDKKIQLWGMSLEELRKSFGWKDIYSVGDTRIDNEHKQLFDIAKEAFEVVDDNKRNEKIKTIIADLYDYMKVHFQHEEDFMKKINYPKLKEQQESHQNIINYMNEFVKRITELDIDLFEKELAKLIDITLVQHILQEDRKIMYWVSKTN
ncbi:MAG: bacteriohemerythrin [Poseidonibacter sp.]|uniref:bacteriohemerythrin n=1 Tax=Poseidonibacter sp. TaxID=2321188 RepID=UPI00359E6CB2